MSEIRPRIPRPPYMKRMLHNNIRTTLFTALGLSIAAGLAFKITVADVRKAKYAAFYKDYDAEKDFEIMRKKGLFSSC